MNILLCECSTCSLAYQFDMKTSPTPSQTMLNNNNIQHRIKSDFANHEEELKFTIFSEKVRDATKTPIKIVRKNFPRSVRWVLILSVNSMSVIGKLLPSSLSGK